MSGLFKGQSMTTKAEQLTSFQSTVCSFGQPLGYAIGTARITSPNLMNHQDFKATEHRESVKTGKKSSSTSITYTYNVYLELALCSHKIDGVLRIWVGDTEYENLTKLNSSDTNEGAKLSINLGDNSNPTAYMLSKHPDIAVGYENMAYAYGYVYLGDGASMPSYNFEVRGILANTGDGIDANPADVILFFLKEIGITEDMVDTASFNNYRRYCKEFDLLVSTPADKFNSQRKCQEYVKELLDITNAYMFCSGKTGKFKIIPRDDRQRGSWRPNTTIAYNLTADDMAVQTDGACVSYVRKDSSEIYNRFGVTFTNRLENNYEQETIYWCDEKDILLHGARTASDLDATWLHTKERAVKVAEMRGRINKTENIQYTFKLPWNYLLEPADLITLTDEVVGLDHQLCMVQSIQEDANGIMTVVALRREAVADEVSYDVPRMIYNTAFNNNVDGGSIEAPLMITPPSALMSSNSLELWIAVHGQSQFWGGCDIYGSVDDKTYTYYARNLHNSIYGKILTSMTVTTDFVDVHFTNHDIVMIEMGDEEDETDYGTRDIWINGEVLSYKYAELIDGKQYGATVENNINYYRLHGLVRGKYETKISAHVVNDGVAVIDGSLISIPLTENFLGQELYFKFLSFNILQKNIQALNDVNYYNHRVILYDIPNVANVVATPHVDYIEEIYDYETGETHTVIKSRNINVSWIPPDYDNYNGAKVFYKKSGAIGWKSAGVSQNNSMEIKNVGGAGTYIVAVATRDIKGNYESADDSTQATVTF